MDFKRRNLLKSVGVAGIGSISSNAAAAKSNPKKEDYPTYTNIKGNEKKNIISKIRSNTEAKKVLKAVQRKGWHQKYNEGKFRSVGGKEYAVIPLKNNKSLEDEEGYLLWLSDSPEEGAPRVAAFMKTRHQEDYKAESYQLINGSVKREESLLSEKEDGVTTQDNLPGGGGCGCLVPVSKCPFLKQNWGCFVDIIGYALSVPAFFAGCAICVGSIGWANFACMACIGAILRGSPLNLPCKRGFYTNCSITDYNCVPPKYHHRYGC